MRALVHKEGLALADGVDVDLVGLEIVGEGLFDIDDTVVDLGFGFFEAVEDLIHVAGIGDHAVEIGGKIGDVFFEGDFPNGKEPFVIPFEVVTTEFDFEAIKSVALDPITEEDGVAVIGLITG